MFRFILVVLVTSALLMGLAVNDQLDKNLEIIYDNSEDYGCVHEEHSQFDDGDSLNLDHVNSLNR
jgi:hypothetical protein